MFYVSAIDGSKYWLMLGPFEQHSEALERVDAVRAKANDLDPRAAFIAFGTCKLTEPPYRIGRMNKYF